MIRKSINHTKECTFVVRVPGPDGFPYPIGTGFFISGDGHFITAYHVIESVSDFSKVRFQQPGGEHVLNVSLIEKWEESDIALLKADFNLNQQRFKGAKNEFLNGKKEFPYLEIAFEEYIEGTPIYIYGFPLSKVKGNAILRFDIFCPRVTSAIISSQYNYFKPIRSPNDPKIYTIDKLLHPGNSGSPAIVSQSGNVFAVCVAFQPFSIQKINNVTIQLPTNFGFISSLSNIKNFLIKELKLNDN